MCRETYDSNEVLSPTRQGRQQRQIKHLQDTTAGQTEEQKDKKKKQKKEQEQEREREAEQVTACCQAAGTKS